MNQEIDKSLTQPNAQRVRCQYVKRETFYSTCGLFARAVLSGGSVRGDIHPNCTKALNAKTCPAIAMRREEVAAEKPLYFKEIADAPYERKVDSDIFDKDGYAIPQSDDPSYQRGWHALEKDAVLAIQQGVRAANARTVRRAPAPEPTPEAALDLSKLAGASMAEVVNAAMKKTNEPSIPPSGGSGSLLDLARQMKAQGNI